ncbi:uncharacterized protein MELLADRAFT_101698 [Melampsora larici-populina 98AG31]|uniref:Uncharacterized protein n=1 Tax=Melampsora larici-populina (strain 98AG31 / pathotype 3-4-7) TaxID=747676 RepID=F4R6P2_MELLP|nr:uncharacterized protein MELLADRAFT_101698 [Melampsora larici-populina 98AG31]EGG12426.1 hypothetical protein MELLADRAFT_101698 [Melampsora larici-populina 98AG31]
MPVASRRQLPPGIRRSPQGIRQTSTVIRQPSTGMRVVESVPVDGLFNMVEQVNKVFFLSKCVDYPNFPTTPNGDKIQYLEPMQTTTGRIVNSFGQIVPAFRRPILISGPTGCLPGSFDARMCNFRGDIVSVDPTKKDIQVTCNGPPHFQLTSSIPPKKVIKSKPPVDLSDRSYGNDANAIASSSSTKIKPRKTKKKSMNHTSMIPRFEIDNESIGKGKAPVRGQGKCTCKV